MEVEVEGADTLARTMRQAAESLGAGVAGADADAARLIALDARRRAPRRTGALASTVTSTGPVIRAGSPTVPYAGYVEYGTRRMSARPFLRPAADANQPRVVVLFKTAAARILSRIRGA